MYTLIFFLSFFIFLLPFLIYALSLVRSDIPNVFLRGSDQYSSVTSALNLPQAPRAPSGPVALPRLHQICSDGASAATLRPGASIVPTVSRPSSPCLDSTRSAPMEPRRRCSSSAPICRQRSCCLRTWRRGIFA